MLPSTSVRKYKTVHAHSPPDSFQHEFVSLFRVYCHRKHAVNTSIRVGQSQLHKNVRVPAAPEWTERPNASMWAHKAGILQQSKRATQKRRINKRITKTPNNQQDRGPSGTNQRKVPANKHDKAGANYAICCFILLRQHGQEKTVWA